MTETHDKGLVNLYATKFSQLAVKVENGEKTLEEVQPLLDEAFGHMDIAKVIGTPAGNKSALLARLQITADLYAAPSPEHAKVLMHAVQLGRERLAK